MSRRDGNPSPLRIAFVCTGNICRSPLAEALARHHLDRAGIGARFVVESFGTHDYHVGDGADPRTVATAARRGIDLSTHRARQVSAAQVGAADLVFAMDSGHLAFLKRMIAVTDQGRLHLFLPWTGAPARVPDVPDPYYGSQEGFDAVHDLLDGAAARMAAKCAAFTGGGHG